MRYRSRIYICSQFLGYIDHEHYALKRKPYALYFYDKNGNIVGHVEPMLNLLARVQIYENDERVDAYTLAKECVFRHKGPIVCDDSGFQVRKSYLMQGNGTEVINDRA